MRIGRLRFGSLLISTALLFFLGAAPEGLAQSQAQEGQPQKIVIPPEELEKYSKTLNLSEMSGEEITTLMRMLSHGARGGTPDPLPAQPGLLPTTASGTVAPQLGLIPTSPSGGGGPALQPFSIFPAIPPAVAGTKEALGRWMIFQAELLYKIGETYAEYGQELLQKPGGSQPAKSAPGSSKQAPPSSKQAPEKKK